MTNETRGSGEKVSSSTQSDPHFIWPRLPVSAANAGLGTRTQASAVTIMVRMSFRLFFINLLLSLQFCISSTFVLQG
jgi:hypothetical protein